ncbi:hypothetical protein LOK49_LG15G00598 [Camellia lanceoleosa]|uniref:Uncharacterized protein n=1 Tax=Camellia lanceoleosa TaxID=1840588 RepID=A0ACC0F0E4_9ERIC|nr:hypothetical protein LOK49_LG15G00598 [Camellia lanceoleosa]
MTSEALQIGTKQWRYYDFCPKVVPPLICLPGTAGTADVYYKQIMSLSMKGQALAKINIGDVLDSDDNCAGALSAFEEGYGIGRSLMI